MGGHFAPYGYTDDGMTPYFPGLPCVHCGRFVGRDGYVNIEYWEMSNEIASLDAEHRQCSEKAQIAFQVASASW